jgi:hypothetical protein
MMEREWSWTDLTAAAPFIAAGFAFAFNVGYFSSIDLGWFTLFSLSEHTVFALRALPVAIGASVVFVIGLNFSQIEQRWKWLSGKSHLIVGVWILGLLVLAGIAMWDARFGLCVSFIAVAAGAAIRHHIPPSQMSFANILYWVGTLLVSTFIVGFLSAHTWLLHAQLRSAVAMKNGPSLEGNLILAGQRGLLIYEPDQDKTKRQGQIRLVLWSDITGIRLCRSSSEGAC